MKIKDQISWRDKGSEKQIAVKRLSLDLKGDLTTSEKEREGEIQMFGGGWTLRQFPPRCLYFLCEAEWGMVAEADV